MKVFEETVLCLYLLLSLTISTINSQRGSSTQSISPPGNLPPGIGAPGDSNTYPTPPAGYPSITEGYAAGTRPPPGLQAYIVAPSTQAYPSSTSTRTQAPSGPYIAGYGPPPTELTKSTLTTLSISTQTTTVATSSTRTSTSSVSERSTQTSSTATSRKPEAVSIAAPSALPNGVSPPGGDTSTTATTGRTGSVRPTSSVTNPSIAAPSTLPPSVFPPGDGGGEYGQGTPEPIIAGTALAARKSASHNSTAKPPRKPKPSGSRSRNGKVRTGKDYVATPTGPSSSQYSSTSIHAPATLPVGVSTPGPNGGPPSRLSSTISISAPASLPQGVSTPSPDIGSTGIAIVYGLTPSRSTANSGQSTASTRSSLSTSASSFSTAAPIASTSLSSSSTSAATGTQRSTSLSPSSSLPPTGASSRTTLPPASPPPPAEPDSGYQLGDRSSSTSSAGSTSASSASQRSTASYPISAPSGLPNGVLPPSDEEGPETSTPNGYGANGSERPGSRPTTSISPPGILPPSVAPPGDSDSGFDGNGLTPPSIADEEALQLPTRKRILPLGPNAGRSTTASTHFRTPDGPRLTTPRSRSGRPSTDTEFGDGFTDSGIILKKTTSTKKAPGTARHQTGALPKKTTAIELSAPGSVSQGKFPFDAEDKLGGAPSEARALERSLKPHSKKVNGTKLGSSSSKLSSPSHLRNGRPSRIPALPPPLPLQSEGAARRSDSTSSTTSALPNGDSSTGLHTTPGSTPAHRNDAKPVLSARNSDLKLAVVNSVSAPAQLPPGVSPPGDSQTTNQPYNNLPAPAPAPTPAPAPAPAPVGPPAPSQYNAQPSPSFQPAPGPYPGGAAPPGSLPVGVSPPSPVAPSYPAPPSGPGVYPPGPGPASPSGYGSPSSDHSSYGPSINPNCVDVHPKCEYFVSNGKCVNPHFSAFVRQVCPRSCSACEVHAYGFHSSGGSAYGGYGGSSSGSGGTYGSIGGGGYGAGGGGSYGGGSYGGGGKPGLGPGDYFFGPPTLPLGPPIGAPGCCGGSPGGDGSYGGGGGGYISGNLPSTYGDGGGCGSGGCSPAGGNYSPSGPSSYGSGSSGCGAGGCGGQPGDQTGYNGQAPGGCGSGGCGTGAGYSNVGPPSDGGYSGGSSGCGSGGCGAGLGPGYGGSGQGGLGDAQPSGGTYGGGSSGCGTGGCNPGPGPASHGSPGSGGYGSDLDPQTLSNWSDWADWNPICSLTGRQYRRRKCNYGKDMTALGCFGKPHESRQCGEGSIARNAGGLWWRYLRHND